MNRRWPCFRNGEKPSGKGKNASDAAQSFGSWLRPSLRISGGLARPSPPQCARRPRAHLARFRFPRLPASLHRRLCFDVTCFATVKAKRLSSISRAVGWRFVTTFDSPA